METKNKIILIISIIAILLSIGSFFLGRYTKISGSDSIVDKSKLLIDESGKRIETAREYVTRIENRNSELERLLKESNERADKLSTGITECLSITRDAREFINTTGELLQRAREHNNDSRKIIERLINTNQLIGIEIKKLDEANLNLTRKLEEYARSSTK